jgi:hypothetical protein
MSRFAKQLIYGSFFLAIIGTVGWWFYRGVVPAPTCTDRIQNGREEGVDCGAAACGVLCAPVLKPLTIMPVRIIAYGNGTYDVLAELVNDNATYGAARVDYTLKVSDASGAELMTRRGITYVNAAQKQQLVIPLIGITGVPASAELQVPVTAVEWARLDLQDGETIEFVVRRDQVTTASSSAHYEATVTNRSRYDFDTVNVAVLLYDGKGELVGAGTTVVKTLLAAEERAFSVDWPFAISGAVRAQTHITTNVFDNDNYIRTHGTQERFQGF